MLIVNTPAFAQLPEPPVFSHPGGWHTDSFQLVLSAQDPAALILYTLDGSEPDIANLDGEGEEYLVDYFFPGVSPWRELHSRKDRTYAYTAPLTIQSRAGQENDLPDIITTYRGAPSDYHWKRPPDQVFKATVVRARVYKDGQYSGTVSRTFFIHGQGSARYTLPVVSIATNAGNLFGYEPGIYVPGWQYFAAGGTEYNFISEGNYFGSGVEWERPLHVEFYESDGGHAFSQNLGMRMHGGAARSRAHKSFRFYARDQYDQANAINYAFFPGATKPVNGEPLELFRRILFRTGGNAQDYLRDAPAHEILAPTRAGIQRSRPVVYFVNGEYWGVIYVRDRQDQHHLAVHYDLDPDNVIILDSPWGIAGPEIIESGVPADIEYYNSMYLFAVENDLSIPQNYEQITALLDVDSYIDYLISFIYLNNDDWYGNKHFRFWRVRQTSDAPFQDGRWRVMVWDFDQSPGTANFDLLINAIHPEGGGNQAAFEGVPERTALLRNLLENDEFRYRFINRFADHMNTTFRTDRIIDIVNTQYGLLLPELQEYFARWQQTATSQGTVDQWVFFAHLRSSYQRQHIRNHLGAGEDASVTIDISDPAQGHIRVNSVDVVPSREGVGDPPYPWTGIYFRSVPIEVEAVPAPGHKFVGWDGLPDGTPAALTLNLDGDVELIARFEEQPPMVLVHYWNFNAVEALLAPSYTVGGASLSVAPGPVTQIISGTGNGFAGENARMGDDAGTHLRVNDPLGAALTFTVPTTGYKDILLQYETRRSGQGAGIQNIAYTTGGGSFTPFAQIVVLDDDPVLHAFDFTGVPDVDENTAFAVRITFEQGVGGVAGNNRFDNVTVEGRPTGTTNSPPIVIETPPLQEIIEEGAPAVIDLDTVFSDPDGDPLTFLAASERMDVAGVALADNILTIAPHQRGDTQITVSAEDGHNPPVLAVFRVLVYPKAAVLAGGLYTFTAWDPNLPERTYPEHMLFLQSDISDPQVAVPLLFPYYIAHDDYHADDFATIGFPYNNTGRTRINGLGEDGISFINTGRDRDLGGALLAVNTEGLNAASAEWLAGTVLQNLRVYGIRLQYRLGAAGPFTDVLDNGQPVEYVTGPDGHTQAMGPVVLPAEALNQGYVQLLWRYHHISGASGPRAELRLDDIVVGAAGPTPGDFTGDGRVGEADLAIFQACATGPDLPYQAALPPGCPLEPDQDGFIAADFDRDGDVDHDDFGTFQRCYSGSDPANPACAQ